MDKITFDFENNTIEITNDRRSGTIAAPELSEKRRAIIRAAGLVQFDAEEMAELIHTMLNKEKNE